VPGEVVLSGVSPVVHHQELNILDVIDEEGLVAGGHHVAGLLVGAKANLVSGISKYHFASSVKSQQQNSPSHSNQQLRGSAMQ
jgi:hypothetical protein